MPRKRVPPETRARITYRQLHRWSQLGYIRTLRPVAKHQRYSYSESEIKVARIIGYLTKLGLPPRFASRVVRAHFDEGVTSILRVGEGRLSASGVFSDILHELNETEQADGQVNRTAGSNNTSGADPAERAAS